MEYQKLRNKIFIRWQQITSKFHFISTKTTCQKSKMEDCQSQGYQDIFCEWNFDKNSSHHFPCVSISAYNCNYTIFQFCPDFRKQFGRRKRCVETSSNFTLLIFLWVSYKFWTFFILQNITTTLLHKRIVLFGGKSNEKDVFFIICVHEIDHFLYAFRHRLALYTVLHSKLFDHFLHIRDVRHLAGLTSANTWTKVLDGLIITTLATCHKTTGWAQCRQEGRQQAGMHLADTSTKTTTATPCRQTTYKLHWLGNSLQLLAVFISA